MGTAAGAGVTCVRTWSRGGGQTVGDWGGVGTPVGMWPEVGKQEVVVTGITAEKSGVQQERRRGRSATLLKM